MRKLSFIFIMLLSFSLHAQCPNPAINANQGINDLIEELTPGVWTPKCDVNNETERNYVLNTPVRAGEIIRSASLNLKFAALNALIPITLESPPHDVYKYALYNDKNEYIVSMVPAGSVASSSGFAGTPGQDPNGWSRYSRFKVIDRTVNKTCAEIGWTGPEFVEGSDACRSNSIAGVASMENYKIDVLYTNHKTLIDNCINAGLQFEARGIYDNGYQPIVFRCYHKISPNFGITFGWTINSSFWGPTVIDDPALPQYFNYELEGGLSEQSFQNYVDNLAN